VKIAIVLMGPMYPDVTGGAEIFALQLALSLAKRGHRVYLIAYRGSKFSTLRYGNLVFCSIKPLRLKVGVLLNSISFFIQLVRLRPDVCLSIFFHSSLPGLLYSIIFRKPHVIRFTGADERVISWLTRKSRKIMNLEINALIIVYSWFLKKLVRWGARRGKTFLIALHSTMRKNLIEFGFPRNSIIVIPNFVPKIFFSIKPNYEQNVIGYVGRLEYVKGTDVLLRAFIAVKQLNNSVKLLIVGDGSLRKYILELAKCLNIEDAITVTGFIPNTEVPKYLSKMSICVLPSRHEGFPNVLLQAMAAGLPIVASSVGGVPELITNGRNGLLVPPDNVKELARAIELLLKNKDMAKSLAFQAREIARKYTIDMVTVRYEKLFKILNH